MVQIVHVGQSEDFTRCIYQRIILLSLQPPKDHPTGIVNSCHRLTRTSFRWCPQANTKKPAVLWRGWFEIKISGCPSGRIRSWSYDYIAQVMSPHHHQIFAPQTWRRMLRLQPKNRHSEVGFPITLIALVMITLAPSNPRKSTSLVPLINRGGEVCCWGFVTLILSKWPYDAQFFLGDGMLGLSTPNFQGRIWLMITHDLGWTNECSLP